MHGFQADATEQASRDQTGSVGPLGCVWTGFRSAGRSCDSRIPADVVTSAWRSQLEQDGVPIDRFFRFTWRDGVWLAYGLKDGDVRGVYCPAHSAQRDEHSFVADSRASERAAEQVLYA